MTISKLRLTDPAIATSGMLYSYGVLYDFALLLYLIDTQPNHALLSNIVRD